MSRVRNADEFLLRLRKIRDDYERFFGPHIAEVRQKYAKNPLGKPPSFVDQSLEAHNRIYIVNGLLAALNWRLDVASEDGLPNLVPEVPVKSAEKETTHFLDYLGLERETKDPLLIVEAKRLSRPLPHLVKPAGTFEEVVSRSLAGEPLRGELSMWLADLRRKYVRPVHTNVNKVPRRVVLTNGDGLILFLDPSDAFLDGGTLNPNRILVFENGADIERRCATLFRHLEHGIVLGETQGLTPGDLPFHITRDTVDRLMHGLRLRYIEQPGIYQPSPVIKVAPIIFLRSRYGAWVRIEAPPREYDLPHRSNQLLDHLTEVRRAAVDLLCQVNSALGTAFQPSPLSKHYEDDDTFESIRGVIKCGQDDEFLIVTGDNTHYVLSEPSVRRCPHHDWAQNQAAGVASNPGPIMVRSIELRSFFISKEAHHCAHRDVDAAKANPITAENQMRCGSRSGQQEQAFCEIWRFESHLCCRTCAFEEVCTKAEVFRLPCQRPSRMDVQVLGKPLRRDARRKGEG